MIEKQKLCNLNNKKKEPPPAQKMSSTSGTYGSVRKNVTSVEIGVWKGVEKEGKAEKVFQEIMTKNS